MIKHLVFLLRTFCKMKKPHDNVDLFVGAAGCKVMFGISVPNFKF